MSAAMVCMNFPARAARALPSRRSVPRSKIVAYLLGFDESCDLSGKIREHGFGFGVDAFQHAI